MSNFTITSQELDVTLNTGIHTRSEADRTLIISPTAGYVVSKDNFVVPNPLPDDVASITLTDTGTPGEPDNTVKVVVGIDPNYVATATDNVITLGITGDANLYIPPPEGAETINVDTFVEIVPILKDCTLSKSAETGITISSNSLSGSVKAGFTNKIAQYTVTAGSNKHFVATPTIELTSNLVSKGNGIITIEKTGSTKDVNGFVTAFVFDINYFSNVNYYKQQQLSYNFTIEALSIPTSTTEFKKIDFGINQVLNLGETRTIKAFGDVGARLTYEVKPTGGSNFTTGTIQIKKSGDYKSSQSFATFDGKFPASSTSTSYELKLTKVSGTEFNSDSIGSSPKTYTINQYVNPVITMSASGPNNANYSDPADIAKTGRPNKLASDLLYLKRTKFNFDLNYSITTTDSSISITKVPEFRLLTLPGDVDSTNQDRVYLSSVAGLVTGMTVVEHSNDTSIPSRTISSINTTDNYVVVSSNFAATGTSKVFTFVKSDWRLADVVPLLNGGNIINITNITATASGQTATIKASETIDIDLSNILNETP